MGVDKHPKSGLDLAVMMLLELLPELERARAREAALVEIVEAVAQGDVYYTEQPEQWNCLFCDGWIAGDITYNNRSAGMRFKHDDDCPVTKARALVAPGAPAAEDEERGQ